LKWGNWAARDRSGMHFRRQEQDESVMCQVTACKGSYVQRKMSIGKVKEKGCSAEYWDIKQSGGKNL
jgi:hypothetical protein